MGIIIVDLDGTLCDSRHREHHAQAKEWEQFHSLLADDQPYEDVAELLRCFEVDYVIACTGRPERYRPATQKWLIKHGMMVDELLMRRDEDWRSDTEVKPELVKEFLGETGMGLRVLFVLEDRDKMVEAWRAAGFNCWQVRPGGY